jgi:hypothetical protein
MHNTLEASNSRSEKSVDSSRITFLGLLRAELPCLLFVTVFITAIFSKVLMGRQSLSRFCLLAEWDSVFQNFSSGKAEAFDPSLVQLLIPNYFLTAGFWHKWELPLWNPYSACGVPLLADIQATVFSPLHLLLNFWPSMQVYNLTLVFEIWLAVVGSYIFARLIGLRPIYSLICSVLYGFCPYNLYYLELLSGTSAAVFPLLLASYLVAAKNFTCKTLTLCAITSAAYVLGGHPESSLYGIATACGFFLFWPAPKKTLKRRCLELTGIGCLALALAAPIILPFIEYLKTGESYKYSGDISAFAPWQGLVLNILSPCLKAASPYLGVLCLPALLALILQYRSANNRQVIGVVACGAVLSLVLISRMGPLHELLKFGPLTYLVTIYLIPVFLLCVIALVCFGLTELSQRYFYGNSGKKERLCSFVIIAAGSLLPLLMTYLFACSKFDFNTFNFDATLSKLSISKHNLLTQTLLTLGYLLAVTVITIAPAKLPWLRRYRGGLFNIITLSITVISLFLFNQRSLPPQKKFELPQPEIIAYLKTVKGRVLPLAEHLLKANANVIYGIASFRIHNPLLPARFVAYVTNSGATVDEFHNQHYAPESIIHNKFIDAAGVKYFLTQFKDLPAPYLLRHTSKEGIRIYENPNALSEAYICRNLQLASSGAQALEFMQKADFFPQSQVIVESPEKNSDIDALRSITCSTRGSSKVTPLVLSQIRNNHFQLTTDEVKPAFLTVTQTYYPGWAAFIDGKEVPLYRTNYLFQGIVLPSGRHNVDLVYFPASFKLGLLLNVLGIFAVAILLFKKGRDSQ